MKHLITFIAIAMSIPFTFANIQSPSEELVPIDHVFVPQGFDSNDNAEIIVTGYLPNLCYRSPFSKVTIVNKKINVEVKSLLGISEPGTVCAEMAVPFMEKISLGVLTHFEKYEITVNGNTRFQKKAAINISEAGSNAIDEHIYAQVHYIEVDHISRKATIRGANPSYCIELDQIKIVSNGKDTVSVLPIMKQVTNHCPRKRIPFSYEFTIPDNLPASNILLHVRSIEGKSFNALFANW